jgi:hypothetical protein
MPLTAVFGFFYLASGIENGSRDGRGLPAIPLDIVVIGVNTGTHCRAYSKEIGG